MSGQPTITQLCTSLAQAARARDQAAFGGLLDQVIAGSGAAPADDLLGGVDVLLPLLDELPTVVGSALSGPITHLAQVGGDTTLVVGPLERAVVRVAEDAGRFLDGIDDEEPPPMGDPGALGAARAAIDEQGLSDDEGAAAYACADAWFTFDEWAQPLLFLLQQRDLRALLTQRSRLADALETLEEWSAIAPWLGGLLTVLDGEPLVVLHRGSGLGFRVTIAGIADNFQLHTLLADAVIRGGVPGRAPGAEALAAATDGEPVPANPIVGQFNLVDATGAWIFNEGRPGDIALHDGVRVVVLDPPPYERSWNAGRAYPGMLPELTVEPMDRAEAATWLAAMAPAQDPV